MNNRFAGTYHAIVSTLVSRLPMLLPSALQRLEDQTTVALTIDDGPNPQGTIAALDALSVADLHATFFLTGAQAVASPALLREITARGHGIASHGYAHNDLFFSRADRVRRDLQRSLEVIEDACGIRPLWYRPPYGRLNPLHTSIPMALRCRLVLWSRMPRDFDTFQKGASLLSNLKSVRGGEILVLHDNSDTVGRLPALIHAFARVLRDRDLKAVPLPIQKESE